MGFVGRIHECIKSNPALEVGGRLLVSVTCITPLWFLTGERPQQEDLPIFDNMNMNNDPSSAVSYYNNPQPNAELKAELKDIKERIKRMDESQRRMMDEMQRGMMDMESRLETMFKSKN